jgi:repressor LexA
MAKLTNQQQKILSLIKKSIEVEGYAPTVRELMEELGVKSPRTISYHLAQLEKKGYLRRTTESSRNIVLTTDREGEPMAKIVRVPLVGWSTGGEPMVAEENILDWLPISSHFLKEGAGIFLLKIKGDSMSPRIENKDVVIVKKQHTAEPHDTIVALIGDDTTVKKYLPREDHIVLQPTNPEYEPIIVFPEEVRIQGRVVGVIKYY